MHTKNSQFDQKSQSRPVQDLSGPVQEPSRPVENISRIFQNWRRLARPGQTCPVSVQESRTCPVTVQEDKSLLKNAPFFFLRIYISPCFLIEFMLLCFRKHNFSILLRICTSPGRFNRERYPRTTNNDKHTRTATNPFPLFSHIGPF